MTGDRIPVLDIGPFLAGTPGARQSLTEAMATTCDDTGFLVITNHGISQSLIDGAFAAASDHPHVEDQQQHEAELQRKLLHRHRQDGG